MKIIILALQLFFFTITSMAQENGMHFEHNTSWEKVLAKAKKEKKYIFVDCYTTWCGPCKMMSAEIFPLREVGDFYNKNFINVKIQLDVTKEDNEEVKSWYASGKAIAEKYKVAAYPTYLMFDPNGNIVHRAVGSSDEITFIQKGKDAMDENKQYYTLKAKYENGNKDPDFLLNMSKSARDAYDMEFASKVVKEYLSTQKNLYTKENLELLRDFTNSSKDDGFSMMLHHAEKVDAVLGNGFSAGLVQRVLLQEKVYPVIFKKGAGDPDWTSLENSLKDTYPAQTKAMILYAKIMYAQQKGNWTAFGPAVVAYMKEYGATVSPEQMNSFAWTIFEKCEDMTCVTNALEWSKQSFASKESPMYMDTYANLLYKSGKKEEAIIWETKAKELAQKTGADLTDYETALEKMKKGEKTW